MNRITLLLIICLLATATSAYSQKSNTTTSQKKTEEKHEKEDLESFYRKMYKNASELRDIEFAKSALFALYTIVPDDTAVQMDLLSMYFTNKDFKQAMFLGEKMYKKDENNIYALDVMTKSQESVGNYSDAVLNYELLYQRTKNSYYQYLSAFCQFQLYRYYECSKYLVTVLQNPDIDSRNVVIDYGDDRTQEVPLRAAILNLDGLIKLELKQKEAAVQRFEEALKVYPEFVFAKNNLDEARKM